MHLKQATTINVKYKPVIDPPDNTKPMFLVQGQPATLYCKYTSNPVSGTLVTWYKNGVAIAFDNNSQKKDVFQRASADASILRIESIEKSIEGEAVSFS